MPVSRLDILYRKIFHTKLFTKGWGSPDILLKLFQFRKIVSNRETCYKLVSKHHPVTIINEKVQHNCRIIEGTFKSPFAIHLPGLVVPEVEHAFFQMVLPRQWDSQSFKPVCIHFAGTGDHYFWRRRNVMAKPLIKAGIGAIILENPYYGVRKPKEQTGSSLCHVSDMFVMGGCLILECLVLLHWCESLGYGPLGVSGLSMGGHMASLAASNWPKPLVLVPCLSWSTASAVFTEGVLSEAIDWDFLQEQYLSDSKYYNILSKSCKIVDDPFECGLCGFPGIRYRSQYEVKVAARYMTPHEWLKIINNASNYTTRNSAIDEKKVDLSRNSFSRIVNLIKSFAGVSLVKEMKKRDQEALWFMRGIMDECTHLKNFSIPHDTALIIAVCARLDGYIPREGSISLEDLWPGATIRYLDTGHVGAYIWHLGVFRKAIIEAFQKAKTSQS